MNYNRLETSLIDVIKEEQAKLGYMKEKISLYYPLSSLNRREIWRSSSITQRRSFLLHCFGKSFRICT